MVMVPTVFFVLVGFVIWVIAESWRRSRQQRIALDFNTRLLDRITSFKDFSDFIQSEAGSKVLDSLAADRRPAGPRDSVLRATQVGVIATTVGVGLLIMAVHGDARVAFVGGIALALGLGFLISSAVSYRLACKLGLIERDGRNPAPPQSV